MLLSVRWVVGWLSLVLRFWVVDLSGLVGWVISNLQGDINVCSTLAFELGCWLS